MLITTAGLLIASNLLAGSFDLRSTKSLALTLKPLLQEGDSVFVLGEYFQDLPAYIGRKVEVVDYEGELAFGIHSEPALSRLHFHTANEFRRLWSNPGIHAFAILRNADKSKWLEDPAISFHVLGRTTTAELIENR